MTSIKLAGFTILMTLFLQTILILGETLLTQETNKDSGLKAPEKRDNFRVPMEMPFDPNFWPARGRRSRRDPEKVALTENCITPDGNYVFDKTGLQCPEIPKIRLEEAIGKKIPAMDFDFIPSIMDDDLVRGGEKMEGECGGNALKEKLGVKIPELLETNFLMNPKRFDKLLHKKQRHFGLPPLILYGNGFYWEPENLYGEKKKKQDVFWVARGKKNLNLSFPQK